MKKAVLFMLLIICGARVFAQKHPFYYYYEGNKVELILDKSRVNIITDDEIEFQKSSMNNINFKPYAFEFENSLGTIQKRAMLEFTNSPSDFEFEDTINKLKQRKVKKHISYYFQRKNGNSIGTSNIFYVKLRNPGDLKNLQETAVKRNVLVVKQVPYMEDWYILRVKYDSDDTSIEASSFFYETGMFDDVDPGFMFNFQPKCTNDPMFGSLWGLNNSVNPNIDINACQAWGVSEGNNIKVAIVDTGIEKTHNDLAANISSSSLNTYSGTLPANGITDGHGTHVSGVVAGVKGNNLQVVGVAPKSKLMGVLNPLYVTSTVSSELASGISWAYQNGADVINNSWGDQGGAYYSNFHSTILENAITNAMNLGRQRNFSCFFGWQLWSFRSGYGLSREFP